MMGIASRFSVLKIEGEDRQRNPNKKKPDTAKSDDKKPGQAKPQAQQQQQQQQRKKGSQASQGQQVNLSSAKGKGKGNPKKKVVTDAQWEEWKKKDEQYVDTNYEDELQEAILQSKLDYAEKKDVYDRVKKEMDAEKKQALMGGKKKKGKAMSLEQFNNMQEDAVNGVEETEGSPEHNGKSEEDPEFFERIKKEAKRTLQHEINKKILKDREPFVDEMISVAQYKMRVEERDKENAELKEEVEKLKDDLTKVKSRNKKLCSILGQAEMRDKAEILVQVDKLQRVRDELTVEVASLHALLEQERSKVSTLTAGDGKGRGSVRPRKSVRFDASSEEQGKKRTASETTNAQ